MAHAVIERFQELEEAYAQIAGRNGRLQARFCAATALDSDLATETLIQRTEREREVLDTGLTRWRTPGPQMRLVYATALTAAGRDAGLFLNTKETLRETRKQRGGRHLQDGGACAALVLVASGGSPSHSSMFYDILAAIGAPWWRRVPAQEEASAAALAAAGETPDSAGELLSRTRLMMDAAGVPSRHIDRAVHDVALIDPDPDDYARAWTALNVAARSRKGLVRRAGFDGLAKLAAQVEDGSQAADALIEASEAITAMRPRVSGMAAGKLALRLAGRMCGSAAPAGAARDLSAIYAMQAAVIAASTAGVVAVVAAT